MRRLASIVSNVNTIRAVLQCDSNRFSSWTLGVGEWPKAGEIDIYEGWNLDIHNKPVFHVGPASEFGSCTIEQGDQYSPIISSNCDNTFADNKTQWLNQGCQSRETTNTIWASPKGGIRKSSMAPSCDETCAYTQLHQRPLSGPRSTLSCLLGRMARSLIT